MLTWDHVLLPETETNRRWEDGGREDRAPTRRVSRSTCGDEARMKNPTCPMGLFTDCFPEKSLGCGFGTPKGDKEGLHVQAESGTGFSRWIIHSFNTQEAADWGGGGAQSHPWGGPCTREQVLPKR